jgi:hypothetical protein
VAEVSLSKVRGEPFLREHFPADLTEIVPFLVSKDEVFGLSQNLTGAERGLWIALLIGFLGVAISRLSIDMGVAKTDIG